jgi:hypothetical protein
MSWDERLHSVEYGPPGSIGLGRPNALSAERTDEGQGISYRRLPASVSFKYVVFCMNTDYDTLVYLGDKSCVFRPQ